VRGRRESSEGGMGSIEGGRGSSDGKGVVVVRERGSSDGEGGVRTRVDKVCMFELYFIHRLLQINRNKSINKNLNNTY